MNDQISVNFWYSRNDVEPLMCRLVDILEDCQSHLENSRHSENEEMILEIKKGIEQAYETGVLDNRPRSGEK